MKQEIYKLGTLNDRDLKWINTTGIIKTIAKGENLISQGQSIDEMYILLAGKVTVFIYSLKDEDKSDRQEVCSHAIGEIMGEMSFVDNLAAIATFNAIEEATVVTLNWQQLKNKIDEDEEFASHFYQTISIQLSNRLRQISALLVQSKTVSEPPLRKVLLVFGILTDRDIDWLIENGMRVNASPNTILIRQGESVEALYILIDGTLAVSITVGEGDAKISKEVAKLASGEIVGEMSFVETGKASATVKSFDRALLLAIPQEELATKLKQDMQFAARFYRAIAVVLVDRLRDGLSRQSGGKVYNFGDIYENSDREIEDELDLNTLNNTAIAGTRFNWMSRRISGHQ